MNSQGNNLLILGAGQYGVMAAEIAKAMGAFGRIAFLDDSFCTCHPECNDVSRQISLIGCFADLSKFAGEFQYGFVAIGNPSLRRKLVEQLQANGITLATLVHPTAYVSPSAKIANGCCIEPNATVQTGATLGLATFVASGSVVRHNADVGEFCHVDCNAVVETLAIVPSETHIACGSVFARTPVNGTSHGEGANA